MTSGWLELQSWHCKQTGSSGCVHGDGTEAGWETCWGGPMLQLLLFQSLASISCAEMSSKGQQAALACASCTKSRKEQERTNQKTQSKERAKCWEEKHILGHKEQAKHTQNMQLPAAEKAAGSSHFMQCADPLRKRGLSATPSCFRGFHSCLWLSLAS